MHHFGHMTPKQDRLDAADRTQPQWSAAAAAVAQAAVQSEPMRRGTSRGSTNSRRHGRTINTSSTKKAQPRAQSALALTSAPLSGYDMTGTAHPGFLDQGQYMDRFSDELDALSMSHMVTTTQPFHQSTLATAQDSMGYLRDAAGPLMGHHVNPQVLDAFLVMQSPESSVSLSPSLSAGSFDAPLPEGVWPAMSAKSPPDSFTSTSPTLISVSPRYVVEHAAQHAPATVTHCVDNTRMTRTMDDSHLLTPDALLATGYPQENETFFMTPAQLGSRRPTGDGESARDHPLYKNAFPQADGLFHCPWEGQACCNHRPEKLKCNYE